MTSLTQLRTLMAKSPFFEPVRNNSSRDNSKNSSVLPSLTSQGNLLAGATTRVGVGFLLNPFSVLKARFEVLSLHPYHLRVPPQFIYSSPLVFFSCVILLTLMLATVRSFKNSCYFRPHSFDIQSNIYAYESFTGAFAIIVRQGPSELLRGFLASSLRDAPYAGLFVVFYEGIKREACTSQIQLIFLVTSISAACQHHNPHFVLLRSCHHTALPHLRCLSSLFFASAGCRFVDVSVL